MTKPAALLASTRPAPAITLEPEAQVLASDLQVVEVGLRPLRSVTCCRRACACAGIPGVASFAALPGSVATTASTSATTTKASSTTGVLTECRRVENETGLKQLDRVVPPTGDGARQVGVDGSPEATVESVMPSVTGAGSPLIQTR